MTEGAGEKKKYILRYGDSSETDVTASFIVGDTIRENLERVLPAAVSRGLVPDDCTPETVRVLFNGKKLNLQLPLEEQAKGIEEFDQLIVQQVISSIDLRLRYKPDHEVEQSETLQVNPHEPLERQIKPFLNGLGKKYRFRGFRRKWFRLYHGERRLNIRAALASKGIEQDCEARLVPWAILGWPPRFLEYAIFAVVLALIGWVVYELWPKPAPPITSYRVTFQSDVECKVFTADDTTLVTEVPAGGSKLKEFPPAKYEFLIMPREYPIFREKMDLSATKAESDSVYWPFDIKKRFGGQVGKMKLTVQGYFEKKHVSTRIPHRLFINRFAYAVETSGPAAGWVVIEELPKGVYEIRYELNNGLFMNELFQAPPAVNRQGFNIDFNQLGVAEEVKIEMFYRRPVPH